MKTTATICIVSTALISSAICGTLSGKEGIDTYKQVEYSHQKSVHKEVCKWLQFVKITDGGVAVMSYTTNRQYLVYASPGEYLRGECGNIAFKVVSINVPLGTVKIEYPYSTTRPTL